MKDLSVLLIDGESSFSLSVARCLNASGVRLHVLSTSATVPLRFSRHCSTFHVWNGCDRDGADGELVRIARQLGVDICLGAGLPAIQFLSQHAGRLRLRVAPVPHPYDLNITADKWAFASFLKRCRLPHPDTILAAALLAEDGARHDRLGELRFPVLLKPRGGSNGIGITRFETPDPLLRRLRDNPQLLDRHIVQSLIPGHDIDCSVLCDNGRVLAYTIQRASGDITTSFRPARRIEFVEDHRVLEVVSALMTSIGWTGVAHVDLRIDARTDEVTLIEVNPRFWGSVLGSLHAGVNFPHLACLAGMGQPFDVPRFRPCRYVSGAGAIEQWLRGRFATKQAGFGVSDTVFRYVLTDPLPTVAETLLGRS